MKRDTLVKVTEESVRVVCVSKGHKGVNHNQGQGGKSSFDYCKELQMF